MHYVIGLPRDVTVYEKGISRKYLRIITHNGSFATYFEMPAGEFHINIDHRLVRITRHVFDGYSSQKACNMESVSMSGHHHGN